MTEDKVLETALNLSEIVDDVGYRQYHKSELPNELDDVIAEICEFIKSTDAEQRKDFIDLLDDQAMWMLFAFSTRMSMLGLRRNSTNDILNGLIALILVTRSNNYQGVLVNIALFYHSISLLKANHRKLFTAACQYAPSEYARNLFLQFLDRSPVDQIIAAFAAKAVRGPNGLAYQFGNQPIPDGWM